MLARARDLILVMKTIVRETTVGVSFIASG